MLSFLRPSVGARFTGYSHALRVRRTMPVPANSKFWMIDIHQLPSSAGMRAIATSDLTANAVKLSAIRKSSRNCATLENRVLSSRQMETDSPHRFVIAVSRPDPAQCRDGHSQLRAVSRLQPRYRPVVWIETCPSKNLDLIQFATGQMA